MRTCPESRAEAKAELKQAKAEQKLVGKGGQETVEDAPRAAGILWERQAHNNQGP